MRTHPFAPSVPAKPAADPSPAPALRAAAPGRVPAIGIGFDGPSLLICAGAVLLLLALGVWLGSLAAGMALGKLVFAAVLGLAGLNFAAGAHRLRPEQGLGLARALQAMALACAFAAINSALGALGQALLAPPPAAALPLLGLWVSGWLGCAALLAALPNAWIDGEVRRWGGQLAILAALALALFGAISLYNPWWGMAPAPVPAWVPGLPVLNGLVWGYALPALMLIGIARSQKTASEAWLRLAAKAGAGLLGALWVVLEIRQAFTGPDLTLATAPPVSFWLWAISLCAAAMAGLYAWRRHSQQRAKGRTSAPQAPAFWQPGPSLPAVRPAAALRQRPAPSARVSGRAKRADPNWAPPRMSAQAICVAVGGANGRMGRALCAAILKEPDFRLVGGCGPPKGEFTGQDLGLLAGLDHAGVPLTEDCAQASEAAQVWIDFSSNAGLSANLGLLHAGVRGAIIGVTGLDGAAQAAVRACASRCAVVQSGNFSLGLNVLLGLVQAAAAKLGPQWDIEILEHHHRHKRDAPSGTALMLGEAAARGRGQDLGRLRIDPRGTAPGLRPEGGIGFASLRGGGTIGEHSVLFADLKESLTLSHAAQDRAIFAAGALVAARWLAARRPPGLYSMQDVLGFEG